MISRNFEGFVKGGRPVRILTPNRVRKLLGFLRGGGGFVGTPTYIPQNDPHDTLITLKLHN